MSKILARIAKTMLFALIPTLFCTIMMEPVSLAVPLVCPEGSKVIGIECFDAAYNNTTPWYRQDFSLSLLSFPLWAIVSLVVAWSFMAPPVTRKQVELIRSLLAEGTRDEAVEKLQEITRLEPYQADKYVDVLQNAPPGADAADAAWSAAMQTPEPQPATIGLPVSDADRDRRWLPTQCPHCGGAISVKDVQWINSFEARCPFCGSVLKAPETEKTG